MARWALQRGVEELRTASPAWSTDCVETKWAPDQRPQPVHPSRSAEVSWVSVQSRRGPGPGEVRLRGGDGEPWRVVLLARQHLTLGHRIALLDVDEAHDAGGAGRHLDDAAVDVGLAVGHRDVGRRGWGGDGVGLGFAGALAAAEPCSRQAQEEEDRENAHGLGSDRFEHRLCDCVGRRLVRQDLAVLEMHHAVGEGLQADVVGDADHRCAMLGSRAAQQPDDHLAALAVEGGGGFVGEQQLRALGNGPGDGDALLLAAGKLGRALVDARRRPTSVSASIARSAPPCRLSPCSEARWPPVRRRSAPGTG